LEKIIINKNTQTLTAMSFIRGKDWERKEASRARGLEGKVDGT